MPVRAGAASGAGGVGVLDAADFLGQLRIVSSGVGGGVLDAILYVAVERLRGVQLRGCLLDVALRSGYAARR